MCGTGYFDVKNTPTQAQSSTAAAIQPIPFRYGGMRFPITFRLDAMVMMTAISGAATTPFRIAAQNSAFTGSMCTKFSGTPI